MRHEGYVLPLFSGFYETIGGDLIELKEHDLNIDIDEYDFDEIYEEVAQAYFKKALPLMIAVLAVNNIANVEYIRLHSPREYNYMNDAILISFDHPSTKTSFSTEIESDLKKAGESISKITPDFEESIFMDLHEDDVIEEIIWDNPLGTTIQEDKL